MNIREFEEQMDNAIADNTDWDAELEALLDEIGEAVAEASRQRGTFQLGAKGGRELFLAVIGSNAKEVAPWRARYAKRVGGRTLLK